MKINSLNITISSRVFFTALNKKNDSHKLFYYKFIHIMSSIIAELIAEREVKIASLRLELERAEEQVAYLGRELIEAKAKEIGEPKPPLTGYMRFTMKYRPTVEADEMQQLWDELPAAEKEAYNARYAAYITKKKEDAYDAWCQKRLDERTNR
jgi:hypothetical protein